MEYVFVNLKRLLVNTVYIDMSTQNRSSGGSRNQKKSNSGSGGGGGGDSSVIHSHKKTDLIKTEKEKSHPTPTAEQLRIAQIIEANISEDPQMREKVFTLIEMTQRSEEEVCCALNECDNNLERAVVFLLETLPVGAFERSSKKKKNKAANAVQDNVGDGEWVDNNANTDKREKSRNRNNNRNGRGGTDSRGWRGREARENERNSRGLDRDDRTNDNYRSNQRGGGRSGRGSGYVGRRGGGRVGAGRGAGGRADRNEYGSRYNANDDHQEVELWDNTIAQNAEKLQQQTQDDAWGDWDNEEYVGSLKNSKVFTTSNLPNQTAASVLSGTVNSSGSANSAAELTAPPGLEHHLGTSVIGGGTTTGQSQGSHLNALVGNAVGAGSSLVDDSSSGMTSANVLPSANTTPLMQYSAAVSSTPQLQQQTIVGGGSSSLMNSSNTQYANATATQFGATVDSFTNAANAAANLVQQVQQQQQQQQQLTPQLKTSATLSAEQSQYFNSLTSQSAAANAVAAVANVQQQQQQVQQMSNYGQNPASVQYQTSYANVFGSAATGNAAGTDLAAQLGSNQQPQVRRARAKLPPPSKIPSTAVEMPGDSLNNIGYLDVQFGALDFGTEDTFENIPDKFNTSVTIEAQQQQQQTQQQSQKGMVQTPQDVVTSYESQTKAGVLAQQQQQVTQQQQQVSLSTGLQGSHLDSLSAGYTQRPSQQQQQVQQQVSGVGSSGTVTGNVALDQLTKNDPYSQTNSNAVVASGYQSAYQGSANVANKAAVNVYQPSVATQGYNNSNYGNVQSSVANTYQPQTYGSYQQNSVNSYQQHQQQQQVTANAQGASNVAASGSVGGGSTTQNIPSVGGSGSNNTTANANTSYLSSAYGSQQNAYQAGQSVYGNAGLSNNTGYSGNTNTSSTQYSNFSASAKLKETSASSNPSHYESVSSGNAVSNSGSAVNAVTSAVNSDNNNNNSGVGSNSQTGASSGVTNTGSNVASAVNVNAGTASNSNSNNASNVSNNSSSTGSGVVNSSTGAASSVVAAAAAAAAVSSATNKNSGGVAGSAAAAGAGGAGSGMVPNIQMVSQYIQTSLPYYQQPVYSYEDLQMMQQRVPHVQGYYDLNYTPTSLGAGRDNLGSVAYSAMTDGRFARTDNNSSPVSNVSSTMSQQAGSSGPMLNVPYAYFYGGNVMPGSFQYGTPAIYPQIPAANTASGGQFPKPSYNTGYGSTNYDALSQASQDYTKGTYPSSVNQQTKSQNVTNPPQAGTASDITSSMYGKGHVALNKVNSYEKQNFHSGTPPPFNMPNTQAAGGTSAQPYGMYLPTMPAAGHHMIHPPIHQMDGRIHNSSRRDSNSTGQRQPNSSQTKSAAKQGYSPSYWTGQN
ncbi:ubiquitin-associated protein-like lingerer isoform 2-T2 [Glossina fuscipes fuscipes]